MKPLTVGEMVAQLVAADDHDAIVEFTFDGETWFQVEAVVKQADGNVTLEVSEWR